MLILSQKAEIWNKQGPKQAVLNYSCTLHLISPKEDHKNNTKTMPKSGEMSILVQTSTPNEGLQLRFSSK